MLPLTCLTGHAEQSVWGESLVTSGGIWPVMLGIGHFLDICAGFAGCNFGFGLMTGCTTTSSIAFFTTTISATSGSVKTLWWRGVLTCCGTAQSQVFGRDRYQSPSSTCMLTARVTNTCRRLAQVVVLVIWTPGIHKRYMLNNLCRNCWSSFPANTKNPINAGLMLRQRLRRWSNIKPALVQCIHKILTRNEHYICQFSIDLWCFYSNCVW